MSSEITLSDVVSEVINKACRGIHVALPAVVEKYDFKTQKANLKINIKQVYGSSLVDMPIIPNVPVIFPKSGGASITMPVREGDGCLLLFCDVDIKNWLLGADNVKPQSQRTHHLSDAVAILGLSTFTKASPAQNNDDLLITYDGSKVALKPKGNVDIHSAKEINIKTESVIINCKTASVKAGDSVTIECKTASIKSSEDSNVECKNANLKAAESITVECKNASVKSTEDSNVECKNANIKASENINAECKNVAVKSLESAAIECKAASIKAAESASIECVSAQVKATGTINTETPMFTQKGDMKIDGKIEVTGVSLLTGKLTTKAGIENSGANLVSNGKTFEIHTHNYQDVVVVIAPEGPCEVTKLPTATQPPT